MITFRYRKERYVGGRIVKRPVADVYFQIPDGNWQLFHPYIDSGADITLIPYSVGRAMGFSPSKISKSELGGLRGSISVAYVTTNLKIGGKIVRTRVAWAQTEKVLALLGRMDIFDSFKVTFDQRKDIITFE